ncbi:hypothetical protein Hdeb2414_s0009g00316571 [Helianthus debilis subsp. tardiflorus]
MKLDYSVYDMVNLPLSDTLCSCIFLSFCERRGVMKLDVNILRYLFECVLYYGINRRKWSSR